MNKHIVLELDILFVLFDLNCAQHQLFLFHRYVNFHTCRLFFYCFAAQRFNAMIVVHFFCFSSFSSLFNRTISTHLKILFEISTLITFIFGSALFVCAHCTLQAINIAQSFSIHFDSRMSFSV